jgi:hypothetical protein
LARPERFDDELELCAIEGKARRLGNADHALAKALLCELEDAVVAIGVVARTAEERIGHPGTSASTNACVVTGGAEAPERGGLMIAKAAERFGALPDRCE